MALGRREEERAAFEREREGAIRLRRLIDARRRDQDRAFEEEIERRLRARPWRALRPPESSPEA